jgi:Zn-dependent peptidase ImmA (M78 family)/transcriptional regulator with XRE-family HTH domain
MAKKRFRSEPATDASPKVSALVLKWARTRAQLDLRSVAEKLGRKRIDANIIEQWERGKGEPTPAQARALAKIYRIPERWLFHVTPPRQFDDLGIVDFRTHDLARLVRPSQNLRSTIEHALALQAWVVDHRARTGDVPVSFAGVKSPSESAKQIAEYLRGVLEVERLRSEASDADDFLKSLRRQVEEAGVLVLRMGQVANKTRWTLDPLEFKGFTLIDEDRLAPLIFVNRKDLNDAQLFTLAHELAHVVTGGSGVSNEDIEDLDSDKPKIEILCDEVAEELLVPATRFEQVWGSKREFDQKRVEGVAADLKVTPLVAGRRVATLRPSAAKGFYSYVTAQRASKEAKSSGGNPYVTYPSWYGTDLVTLLASAATTEHPAGSDALDLLGVTLAVAQRLAEPKRGKQTERKPLPKMDRFPLVEIDDSWRTESRSGR